MSAFRPRGRSLQTLCPQGSGTRRSINPQRLDFCRSNLGLAKTVDARQDAEAQRK